MMKTRKDIVTALSEKLGDTKKHTSEILDALREVIDAAVVSGDGISITGLGTMSVVDVAAKTARNPQTGEAVEVGAHKDVKVKLSKKFRASANA